MNDLDSAIHENDSSVAEALRRALQQAWLARAILQLTLAERSPHLSLDPFTCSLCREPVSTRAATTYADEHGNAVHRHCYLQTELNQCEANQCETNQRDATLRDDQNLRAAARTN
jgi:hypothetical protein